MQSSCPSYTCTYIELQLSTFQSKAFRAGGALAGRAFSSSSEEALPSGSMPLSGPDLLHEHTSKPLALSSNRGTYARGCIYCGCWKATSPIPSPLPSQPLQWIPFLRWNNSDINAVTFILKQNKSLQAVGLSPGTAACRSWGRHKWPGWLWFCRCLHSSRTSFSDRKHPIFL